MLWHIVAVNLEIKSKWFTLCNQCSMYNNFRFLHLTWFADAIISVISAVVAWGKWVEATTTSTLITNAALCIWAGTPAGVDRVLHTKISCRLCTLCRCSDPVAGGPTRHNVIRTCKKERVNRLCQRRNVHCLYKHVYVSTLAWTWLTIANLWFD